LTERAVNTTRYANLSDVDWSDSGLSDHQVEGFQGDFATTGVIFAGFRTYTQINGHWAKARTVTAAYHRLEDPSPDACFVGGCSGEVCSEVDGIVTTCTWEPWYACYASATCGRQADGSCDWNPTAELTSCLAMNH